MWSQDLSDQTLNTSRRARERMDEHVRKDAAYACCEYYCCD